MPLTLPAFLSKGSQRRSPSELVALDLATTGVKAVHFKKEKEVISVLGVDVLPPLETLAEQAKESRKPLLPKNLIANYASLTLTASDAAIRVLTLPAQTADNPITDEQVREHSGLGEELRMAYTVATVHKGKAESRVLVAAIPEAEAVSHLAHFAEGPPAPVSFEVAGLAAMNGYLQGPGKETAQEGAILIESGARLTLMAIFNKGVAILARKFEFGVESIVAKVQQDLGVDVETARGIVADGSFDISQSVHLAMDPFLRQLSISKDFVERREDCHITRIGVSGGATLLKSWREEIGAAAGVEVMTWNPFDGFTMAEGAYPESLQGQETRFAAAVGGAMGVWWRE